MGLHDLCVYFYRYKVMPKLMNLQLPVLSAYYVMHQRYVAGSQTFTLRLNGEEKASVYGDQLFFIMLPIVLICHRRRVVICLLNFGQPFFCL